MAPTDCSKLHLLSITSPLEFFWYSILLESSEICLSGFLRACLFGGFFVWFFFQTDAFTLLIC